ncbi:nitroreductase family protein [Anaerotignum lactatifermentans]|uniref:Nitroreductase family protein n=1 Tax=Anaerotignum lactatifermentans TaxID=160404 RepID=A0ABS2GB01_9FIRM|nr:nitroreductase family protein [Anaerotignum lactatifermentans]MBM6828546.1 nitroreductase family protein [Anaerotignum lactatifermentans]MBM6877953.1 nitroreductase family protein [Anaerotignum lactatifermentans]MBM6950128.1 nitroreductase family protein [Anaerotignum lactatifermentans]
MILVHKEKCIGCGSCERDCFSHTIQVRAGKAEVLGKCMECGHCLAVCPTEAVEMEGYDQAEVFSGSREECMVAPADFLRFLQFRRSTRQYEKRPVESEKLAQILEAGRYTPTARNRQDVHFVFVQEQMPQIREMIWEGFREMAEQWEDPGYRRMLLEFCKDRQANPENDRLFCGAPVLLVLTCAYPWNGELTARTMELMAESLGLGSLYSGFIQRAIGNSKAAQQALSIEGERIAACLLLGYPAVRYLRSVPRKKAHVTWL